MISAITGGGEYTNFEYIGATIQHYNTQHDIGLVDHNSLKHGYSVRACGLESHHAAASQEGFSLESLDYLPQEKASL